MTMNSGWKWGRAVAAFWALGLVFPAAALFGQESSDAEADEPGDTSGQAVVEGAESVAEPARFENSLGMGFLEVADTPILLSVWETRVSDYRAFVEASGYAWNETPPFEQDDDHPVVNINRNDAVVFCQWLTRKEQEDGVLEATQSYRLPTNAEWTVAIGVGLAEGDRRYPWGNAWPPPPGVANLSSRDVDGSDDGFAFTAPVGSFAGSGSGIFDLGGNVWEWCEDRESRGGDAAVAPVLRGGAFNYFRAANLETAYRYEAPATMRAPSFGFRIVLEDQKRNTEFLAATQGAGQSLQDAVAEARAADEARRAAQAAAMAQQDILPEPSARPERGQAFRSSLGLAFVPVENVPFLVGSTEVRLRDFQTYGRVTGAEVPTVSFSQGPDHPVVGVSWSEAVAFAEWLTAREFEGGWLEEGQRYRLPTDAEWSVLAGLNPDEPAEGPRFLWGTDWPPPVRSGNYEANRIDGYFDSSPYTSDVATYREDRPGLYDLSGNAAEWVAGQEELPNGSRVARGGSWTESLPEGLESFRRLEVPQGKGRPDVGFRLILDLGE